MTSSIECILVGALATNCWIYTVDGDTTVIDPGGDAAAIIRGLKSSGKTPARILLTHGHFDHIQALPELHEAFPLAPVALHRADCDYVNENGFNRQCFDFKTAVHEDAFVRDNWRDMPQDLVLLDEGAAIGPFVLLHTPGHTKGSSCYYHADAGGGDTARADGTGGDKSGVLFSGDTLFRGGIGRTDLYGGNMAEMTASLKRLFALPGSVRVFPGHGGATSIEAENGGVF